LSFSSPGVVSDSEAKETSSSDVDEADDDSEASDDERYMLSGSGNRLDDVWDCGVGGIVLRIGIVGAVRREGDTGGLDAGGAPGIQRWQGVASLGDAGGWVCAPSLFMMSGVSDAGSVRNGKLKSKCFEVGMPFWKASSFVVTSLIVFSVFSLSALLGDLSLARDLEGILVTLSRLAFRLCVLLGVCGRLKT